MGRDHSEPGPAAITVVVPCYNPGPALAATLAQLTAALARRGGPSEIIVVDDGSRDGSVTGAVTAQRAKQPRSVQLRQLTHAHNQGKGAALRNGMAAATGALVGFVDADGDIDAATITAYAEQLTTSGADAVVGSKRHSGSQVSVPPWRRAASATFRAYARLAVPTGVSDTQVGAKLFRAEVLAGVLALCREDRFLFDLELLYELRRAGARIEEAPVRLRMDGQSSVSGSDVAAMAAGVLRLAWQLRTRRRRRLRQRSLRQDDRSTT